MEHVKLLRKAVGIKQHKMAEMLNIDQSNYCNIENGRLVPLNLDAIKQRCLNVLLPEIDKLIQKKNEEISVLSSLKNPPKN
jgi:DNA-binding XRE family transcriptional regulator